jgi:hypothetical protein
MTTGVGHREIREVFFDVEERGARNVPGEVELPPPGGHAKLPTAVDELCPHRPRE